jgi:hypothetical protein
MSRLVLFSLWGAVVFGFLVAAGIGIAAGDLGMVQGAAAAAVGGLVAAPFVARMWRGGGDRMG